MLAALLRQPLLEGGVGHVGAQVDMERGFALRADGIAQRARQRIDGATFDARLRDHRLAARILPLKLKAMRFRGWPWNLSRKISDQETRKPAFDGARDARVDACRG